MKDTPNLSEIISNLRKSDVYSVLCSFLYDLHKVPEYTTLSELCYLLDIDSFMNFIKYFAGKTVKVPTKKEFSDAMQVLLLFQYYEIEKRPWKDCLTMCEIPTSKGKLMHNKLDKLKETMKKYNFGNREY